MKIHQIHETCEEVSSERQSHNTPGLHAALVKNLFYKGLVLSGSASAVNVIGSALYPNICSVLKFAIIVPKVSR